MPDLVILINLLIIIVLLTALPIIGLYYMFVLPNKRTPRWLLYGVLVSIILFFLDRMWREDAYFLWPIVIQFVLLFILLYEQFQYQREDAAKTTENADEQNTHCSGS